MVGRNIGHIGPLRLRNSCFSLPSDFVKRYTSNEKASLQRMQKYIGVYGDNYMQQIFFILERISLHGCLLYRGLTVFILEAGTHLSTMHSAFVIKQEALRKHALSKLMLSIISLPVSRVQQPNKLWLESSTAYSWMLLHVHSNLHKSFLRIMRYTPLCNRFNERCPSNSLFCQRRFENTSIQSDSLNMKKKWVVKHWKTWDQKIQTAGMTLGPFQLKARHGLEDDFGWVLAT